MEKIILDVENVYKGLRRAWFPVARSQDLQTPQASQLLGERLVVFRTEDGKAAITESRCPHRGADLATGVVKGNDIECPYHGWKFNGEDGSCTLIPSLGECSKIPSNACIKAYPAIEKFGLVWTCLEDPIADLPDLPELDELNMTYMVGLPIPTKAGVLAAAENFRDVAHFPFVHGSTMGGVSPQIEPLHPRIQGYESWLSRTYQVNGAGAGTYAFDDGITVNYHAVMPSLVSGRFDYQEKGQRIILECFQPLGAGLGTIIYPVSGTAENYTVSTPEQALEEEEFVINEDKPVLDNLWPLEVPLNGEYKEVSVAADLYTLKTRSVFVKFVKDSLSEQKILSIN